LGDTPSEAGQQTPGDSTRWLKNSFVYLIILIATLLLLFHYFGGVP
jgi:hypothetical protein